MNYKALTASMMLILIAPVLNAKSSNLSHRCPSIKAVQAAASNFRVKEWDIGEHVWFAYQNNNFETKSEWTFIIEEVRAKNPDEAYRKLISSLVDLRFKGGTTGTDDGSIECHYSAAYGLIAGAVSPSINI